jgi:MFS family permease
MSFYLTGVWVGIGMAFILGGAVIDIVTSMDTVTVPFLGDLKPWQVVFMAVGAPGLIFPLILLTVREPLRRNKILKSESSSTGQISLKNAMSFVWGKRRTYAPLFLSLGLYAAFGLGASFWTVEFFIREFGIGRSNISYIYGTLALVLGTTGSLSGGWIADFFERRGIKDAKILAALLGMSVMLPFAVMFPLMPSVELAIVGVAGVVFCTPFPYGPSVAAIQVVTPNEMRGFVSGIYVFVAVVIGLGVGPPLVAALTDYVFQSPELLPLSIVAAAGLLVPAAVLCMHIARKQYKKSLIAAQEWTDPQRI